VDLPQNTRPLRLGRLRQRYPAIYGKSGQVTDLRFLAARFRPQIGAEMTLFAIGCTRSGAALSTSPTPRLDTIAKVRREAAKLYNQARRGEISASDASKLGSLLALIARLIEGGELERRLVALEEQSAPDSPR
jgi:hypothetical protein